MKTTLHPQLLVAVSIALLIVFGRSRSTASPQLHLPDIQPMMVDQKIQPIVVSTMHTRKDPFISPIEDETASTAPTVIGKPVETAPSTAPSIVRLHAVIVGRQSYALVEDNGVERFVRIGDSVQNTTVRAIRLDGIDLADGRHLVASTSTR